MLFIAEFLAKGDDFPDIIMAESFSADSLEDAIDYFCNHIMDNDVLQETYFMCFAHYFHFLNHDLKINCNNLFSLKMFNELISDYCYESSKLDKIRDMYPTRDETLEFRKNQNGKLNEIFINKFYSLPRDILELLVKDWIKENITFYQVMTMKKISQIKGGSK